MDRNNEMVSCKISKDLGRRIRDVSRVLGQSMGRTIEQMAIPVLPALEKEAISRFSETEHKPG